MKSKSILLAFAALPFAASAAPESYTLDPFHTYPNFEVDHLGFSTMRGFFTRSSGKMVIDLAAKTGSIDLTVETASISTGDNDKGTRARARDEHLRTADFFNVQEFPRMTYKSTRVTFNGDVPATVEGNLTLLGTTKPLAFKVERWKCGENPNSKRAMCGGNASGKFKRTDFGMKYGVPAVGDEITLFVEFEAYKD